MSDHRSITAVGLYPTVRALLDTCFSFPSELSRSGLQLFVFGATLAALRTLFQITLSFIDRTFIARSEIDSRDEAFQWVVAYLGEEKKDALHFTVSTQKNRQGHDSVGDNEPLTSNPLRWIPAPGLHLLMHNHRAILVRRSLNGEAGQSGHMLKPSKRLETLSLSTLSMHPSVLHSLIEHARTMFMESDQSRTVVYSGTQHGDWQRLHSRPIRPLSTVIISPSIMDPLLDDIRNHLKRETEIWYASRGIPYRRGYLFYGPPGTGKTSLAVGLAGEFKLGVYVVSLSGKSMNDDTLIELLGSMPRRSILLFEDIDVAFPNRSTQVTQSSANGSTEPASGVTSSGLLNALDGVAAQEGRIVILTTNFVERLDSALIRPGRVDRKIAFTVATREDVKALFKNFFGDEMHMADLADQFAEKVKGGFSIAALQGYLMTMKHDPQAAILHVEAWVAQTNQSILQ